MSDAKAKSEKGAGKKDVVLRIVLVVILAVVAILAIRLYSLRGQYNRALALYDEGNYQEACDILEPVIERPLAVIKVRKKARQLLGQCKAQIAVNIKNNERDYARALELLKQAKELDPASTEIDRHIKDCETALAAPGKKPALPTPPGE